MGIQAFFLNFVYSRNSVLLGLLFWGVSGFFCFPCSYNSQTLTTNMKSFLRLLPGVILAAGTLFVSAPAEAKWDNHDDRRGSLVWRGRVDDKVDLYIRDRSVRAMVVSGRRVENQRYDFDGRLPRRTEYVRLEKIRGRGAAYVRQQPRSSNNYTAIVRIYDPLGGAAPYRLRMKW